MAKTIRKVTPIKLALPKRLRVAAYARVSTGKDAMLHSLSAQVSHYSSFIQKNPQWSYAGVYADAATTGTKGNRSEFQRMLADCRSDKIDMIITKSISRFARNTVTLLETVRELKSLGVDVYFEEQNIHTMSGDGELMLTILASHAQEESRSVSENCKWRIRRNYENGIPRTVPAFGYQIIDHQTVIDESEAATVRMIYDMHNSGMGLWKIASILDGLGIAPPRAEKWDGFTVQYILKNERYMGDMLLQKSFIADHLEKRKLRNRGELDQFYVEGVCPAIISTETFELAQRISALRTHDSPAAPPSFHMRLICPKCGMPYKRKIAHGNAAWNCSTFIRRGKAYCHGKQIPEAVLIQITKEITDTYGPNSISHIEVPAPNHLTYILNDGTIISRTWEDRSRRNSWNDEMRQQAAENRRKRWNT